MSTDNIPLFNVDKEKLMQLAKIKNQDILQELGGVDGIVSSLKTYASYGIHGDATDQCQRINIFESSSCRIRGVINWYLLAILDSFNDLSLLFLCACCVYLIIVGIKLYGRSEGWQGGAFVLFFTSMFDVISSIIGQGFGDYFDKAIKGSQLVIVLRNGLKQLIPVSNILVGDIALLKKGDKIPADGLLLEAYEDQSLKLDDNKEIAEINYSYPFLNTGAKVVEGQAKMMVTRTTKGKNFGCNYEMTELGTRINCLTRVLEIMRLALTLSSIVISLSLYFFGIEKDPDGNRLFDLGAASALEVSYVVVEYIVAGGVIYIAMDTTNFSWALEVCFAHAINVMAACNVIVRDLSSWEKIGLGVATINVTNGVNASNITSNFLFVPQILENRKASSHISPNVLQLIQQGIGLNTTGISNHTQRKCEIKFLGCLNERAFLSQAALKSDMDWEKLINNCAIIKVETLENHGRVILVKKDDSFLEHRKGPAEMTLAMCSDYYDDVGIIHPLNEDTRSLLEQKLQSMNSDSKTQVITLAYRCVPAQELQEDSHLEPDEVDCCYLLGFVVLKEVYRDEIVQDVKKCRSAGMDLNIFHEEYLDSGAARAGAADTDPGEIGTNQCLENETLPLENDCWRRYNGV